ncbi:hypothetical protein [Methanobrevibacter sp.]
MIGSDFFDNDDDLVSQLRSFFEPEEMWNIDFAVLLNQATETENGFNLVINNRTFFIDEITGIVSEVDVE